METRRSESALRAGQGRERQEEYTWMAERVRLGQREDYLKNLEGLLTSH